MYFNTLRDIYDNSVVSYKDNLSFSILNGEQLTYAEFDKRVRALQQVFYEAGIRKGDKVAIYSRSLPNWPVAYFACVTVGIVAVPLLPDFTGAEVEKLLRHAEAKALIVNKTLKSAVSQDAIDSLDITLLADDLSVIQKNSASSDANPQVMAEKPEKEDLAVIIYTSGTTSEPKGVMLSHRALAMQINMYPDFFTIKESDVFLSILPLSHTYEASIGMIYPFAYGCSVTYLDRLPTASALIPAFAKLRPTVLISVPLVLDKIYRSQIRGKITAKKWTKWSYEHIGLFRRVYHALAGKVLAKTFGGRMRFIGIGGAKLSTDTDRFMYESGLPYAIGYGLTETAPLLLGAPPGTNRVGTTGWAVSPLVQTKLDNVDPVLGTGELLVRTPSIMNGYFKNPEATRRAITDDGWFRTNDIVAVDKKGYMSIVGRANNMIVGPSGENIYPEEIEGVLNTYPVVSESIVLMEKNALVALVSYESDKLEKMISEMNTTREEAMDRVHKILCEYVNSKVNKFSRISSVQDHFEPFEKTATQKIKRKLYVK